MVRAAFSEGIVSRAIGSGVASVAVHDLRDYTTIATLGGRRALRGWAGHGHEGRALLRAVEALMPEGAGADDALVLLSPVPGLDTGRGRGSGRRQRLVLCAGATRASTSA